MSGFVLLTSRGEAGSAARTWANSARNGGELGPMDPFPVVVTWTTADARAPGRVTITADHRVTRIRANQ